MQAKSATPPLAVPQRPKESSFALPPPITCKTHGTVLDGDAACDLFPLLRTVSGVVIMPCSWWQCEGLHFDDELGAEMVGDRPVHDSPGVHVQDSSAIHPPFGSAVLGDVGEPQPVGPVGVEPVAARGPPRPRCQAGDTASGADAPLAGRRFASAAPPAYAPQPAVGRGAARRGSIECAGVIAGSWFSNKYRRGEDLIAAGLLMY
jgi:hypothetical protein